ncbi:hypothetical protein [Methylosinus sp. LW4]|uniref:hypothetical protein n=1 Tax=Methylosinus sp. LW4 TaxID=136993 RepID=UPI00035C502D|nr:hypothetical protein [Methylosinus sp. LW4]
MKATASEETSRDLFAKIGVRVGRLFWLDALDYEPSDDFRDFVEDDLEDETDILEALPYLRDAHTPYVAETVLDLLREKRQSGFIALLETPSIVEFFTDDSCVISWARTHLKWVFASSLTGLEIAATAFSVEVMDSAKLRHLAKKPAAEAK